jgi:hypothetical protein
MYHSMKPHGPKKNNALLWTALWRDLSKVLHLGAISSISPFTIPYTQEQLANLLWLPNTNAICSSTFDFSITIWNIIWSVSRWSIAVRYFPSNRGEVIATMQSTTHLHYRTDRAMRQSRRGQLQYTIATLKNGTEYCQVQAIMWRRIDRDHTYVLIL